MGALPLQVGVMLVLLLLLLRLLSLHDGSRCWSKEK
jgi:hypothetical protein